MQNLHPNAYLQFVMHYSAI